jgi:hypothetical protein
MALSKEGSRSYLQRALTAPSTLFSNTLGSQNRKRYAYATAR